MPFYFENHPTIAYDINKDGNTQKVHNILVRSKIQSILKSRTAVYYEYDVKENERADSIAEKYYNDATLSWIIYMTNDILDPSFDWPLSYESFIKFITVNDDLRTIKILDIKYVPGILAAAEDVFK